jgi:hypothetical protein
VTERVQLDVESWYGFVRLPRSNRSVMVVDEEDERDELMYSKKVKKGATFFTKFQIESRLVYRSVNGTKFSKEHKQDR